MAGKRDWNRHRSTHAEVLETLAAVIAAHPSSGGRASRAPGDEDFPHTAARAGNVIPLRPRLVLVGGDGSTGPGDGDGPAAA